MTEKERRFCEEYIIDLNASAAARRAGYSEKTCGIIGFENLKKPKIAALISELKQARTKRTEITADKVLNELAKIGFSNISDFVNDDMSMKELKAISRKKSAAISSIKKTRSTWGENGEKVSVEFKLYDKKGALELIGRHLGFFKEDNQQKGEVIKTYEIIPASQKEK